MADRDKVEAFGEELDRLLESGEAPDGASRDPLLELAAALHAALPQERPSAEFRARLKAELLEQHANNVRPFPTSPRATVTPPAQVVVGSVHRRHAVVAVLMATAATVALLIGYGTLHQRVQMTPTTHLAQFVQSPTATPTSAEPRPTPAVRGGNPSNPPLQGNTAPPPAQPTPTPQSTMSGGLVAQHVNGTTGPATASPTPSPAPDTPRRATSPTPVHLRAGGTSVPPVPHASRTPLPATATPTQATPTASQTAQPQATRSAGIATKTSTVPPAQPTVPLVAQIQPPSPTATPVQPTATLVPATPALPTPTPLTTATSPVPTADPIHDTAAATATASPVPPPAATATSPVPTGTPLPSNTPLPTVTADTPIPAATGTATGAPTQTAVPTATPQPATATAVPSASDTPPAASATAAPTQLIAADTPVPPSTVLLPTAQPSATAAPQPTLVAQQLGTGTPVKNTVAANQSPPTSTPVPGPIFPLPDAANAGADSPLYDTQPLTAGLHLKVAGSLPSDPGLLPVIVPVSHDVAARQVLKSFGFTPLRVSEPVDSTKGVTATVILNRLPYRASLQGAGYGYVLSLRLLTAAGAPSATTSGSFDAESNARAFLHAHNLDMNLQRDSVVTLADSITVTFTTYLSNTFTVANAGATLAYTPGGLLKAASVHLVDDATAPMVSGISAATALANVASGQGWISTTPGTVVDSTATITGTTILYVPVVSSGSTFLEPLYRFTGTTTAGTSFQIFVPAIDASYLP